MYNLYLPGGIEMGDMFDEVGSGCVKFMVIMFVVGFFGFLVSMICLSTIFSPSSGSDGGTVIFWVSVVIGLFAAGIVGNLVIFLVGGTVKNALGSSPKKKIY